MLSSILVMCRESGSHYELKCCQHSSRGRAIRCSLQLYEAVLADKTSPSSKTDSERSVTVWAGDVYDVVPLRALALV